MSVELTHPVSNAVRKALPLLGVTKASKILVGASGGLDSMVLLYILHQSGYTVSAAHINFNLREDESVNDALFVRNWCLDQDIPFIELSKDTRSYAEANNLNTQTAARNIRYEWWEYLVHTHQFDFVATAHHLDDTIETVFMNLFRGTGMKGLRGIPPARDFYIRPMLDCSRSAIESFAKSFDIPFRTDASNLTDHYQRNKLRHHLIPMLEEFYPGLHTSMRHTLHRINLEWEAWDYAYSEWEVSSIQKYADGFIIQYISAHLPFCLRWLEEKGFPWMLSYDFLSSTKADSNHVLQYEQYKLSRTENGFYLEETRPELQFVLPKPGKYTFGNFAFTIDQVSPDAFMPDQDPWTEYVSGEALQWPLTIRNIRPGDDFQPLGMQGRTKKLQDLMVDRKLELFEKERVLLLTTGESIVWVIGIRLDERARVTADSNLVYRLTYSALSNG